MLTFAALASKLPQSTQAQGTDIFAPANVVAYVLGFFSILLGILFYHWSTKQMNRTTDAANRIELATCNLKELFQTFHTETFALLRDMVIGGAMKRLDEDFVAAERAIDSKTDETIEEIKQQTENKLEQLMKNQAKTEVFLMEMRRTLMAAVNETREIERKGQDKKTRAFILQLLEDWAGDLPGNEVCLQKDAVVAVLSRYYSASDVEHIFAQLTEEGITREEKGEVVSVAKGDVVDTSLLYIDRSKLTAAMFTV